jgi:hypothetical protein
LHHRRHGYAEILRELLKKTPLRNDGIKETKGEGDIFFRNVPLIDIIRHLSENIGWTFRVDKDKIFYFQTISPPEDSGIVITDKDMISMKLVKG